MLSIEPFAQTESKFFPDLDTMCNGQKHVFQELRLLKLHKLSVLKYKNKYIHQMIQESTFYSRTTSVQLHYRPWDWRNSDFIVKKFRWMKAIADYP
mmetsp:Transcript_60417/g.123276  ORF Transcript_60417/g.123276 Transcript_60417/m.123276 type:complete len:96 (-) Transcript_60417:964-1251(-)